MKRHWWMVVGSILLLLTGCSAKIEAEESGERIENLKGTQLVEVFSTRDRELIGSLDDAVEIESFTEALHVEKWVLSDLPDGSAAGPVYAMYKEPLRLHSSDKQEKVAELTAYRDVPYVRLKSSLVDAHFKVPQPVADYLSSAE